MHLNRFVFPSHSLSNSQYHKGQRVHSNLRLKCVHALNELFILLFYHVDAATMQRTQWLRLFEWYCCVKRKNGKKNNNRSLNDGYSLLTSILWCMQYGSCNVAFTGCSLYKTYESALCPKIPWWLSFWSGIALVDGIQESFRVIEMQFCALIWFRCTGGAGAIHVVRLKA